MIRICLYLTSALIITSCDVEYQPRTFDQSGKIKTQGCDNIYQDLDGVGGIVYNYPLPQRTCVKRDSGYVCTYKDSVRGTVDIYAESYFTTVGKSSYYVCEYKIINMSIPQYSGPYREKL